MTRYISLFFTTAVFGTGCLTGNSYPDQYASSYCDALFTCVPEGHIDGLLGFDSIDECTVETAEGIRNSSSFDSFQEGDLVFRKEKAESCIDEADQMLADESCDGNMDILSFSLDAAESDCSEVYDD